MNRLFNQLSPFIVLGVIIVTLFFGAVLLSYLFFFGLIFGTILYIFNTIRQKFLAKTKPTPSKKQSGRVIDSDDWHILP